MRIFINYCNLKIQSEEFDKTPNQSKNSCNECQKTRSRYF